MERLAFFLPNRRCPHRCIYCDQGAITGERELPSPEAISEELGKHTKKMEICFFGGSFTCLDIEEQKAYLRTVFSAPEGSIVRFSTHPLCINENILSMLKDYPVSMVELGISSLSNDVLKACRRGYDDTTALRAMKMVISAGFSLGAQMMIGLPFQDRASSIRDIERIAEIAETAPVTLRIYPCLVLEHTYLETLLNNGSYNPLNVEEAALWAGTLLYKAVGLGLKVQRIGLQETESLDGSVKAGPHHPALGEMAKSQALVLDLTSRFPEGPWEVPRKDISLITGHGQLGLRLLSASTDLEEQAIWERITFI